MVLYGQLSHAACHLPIITRTHGSVEHYSTSGRVTVVYKEIIRLDQRKAIAALVIGIIGMLWHRAAFYIEIAVGSSRYLLIGQKK